MVVLGTSVALGVVISFAISLCATVNSPLATSITGNAKDVVGTLLGWVLFGGFVATTNSVTGLLLSFSGAAYYSYIKLAASQAPALPTSQHLAPLKARSPLYADAKATSPPLDYPKSLKA